MRACAPVPLRKSYGNRQIRQVEFLCGIPERSSPWVRVEAHIPVMQCEIINDKKKDSRGQATRYRGAVTYIDSNERRRHSANLVTRPQVEEVTEPFLQPHPQGRAKRNSRNGNKCGRQKETTKKEKEARVEQRSKDRKGEEGRKRKSRKAEWCESRFRSSFFCFFSCCHWVSQLRSGTKLLQGALIIPYSDDDDAAIATDLRSDCGKKKKKKTYNLQAALGAPVASVLQAEP